MAIDDRNFSIEGVEDILNSGNSALTQIGSNFKSFDIFSAINRINQKIIFLKKLEEKVISLFPDPNDRASIRAKVMDYNTKNFSNFFSTNLKNEFIKEFKEGAETLKSNEQMQQNLLAEYIVQQLYLKLDSSLSKADIAKEIAKQFNFTISAIITPNGTRVSTRSEKIIEMEDKVPHIVVDKLTDPMRERLQQILNGLDGQKQNYRFPNLKHVNLSGFKQGKDKLDIKVSSVWLSNIKGLKYTEIKKLIEEDPNTWWPVVQKANENILSLLRSKVSGEVRMYLDNYLRGVLATEPFLFFVGKSSTDVTGLLGEIAAVLAIQALTGKTVPVEWVAHNTADGKKVSIDVVLHDCLGINVKNTTKDFFDYGDSLRIKFVDRNPEEILNTLLDHDNSNNSEALSDAFQTSYFNVSYKINSKDTPHVYAGANDDFDNIAIKLVNFREHLITYLYQFAPEMLYMATDDLEKQLLILDNDLSNKISGAGNILYMVGGIPFFPSEMLQQLVDELKELINNLNTDFKPSSFKISSSNSSDNIISYLNSQASRGISVKLEGRENINLPTIKMTSSWLFSN